NGTASITTQTAADVTVTAKTDASIDAGTTLSASVTLTGPVPGSTVKLSSPPEITEAIVDAPGAAVYVFSGGNANLNLGDDGSPIGSAGIAAFGHLDGEVFASGNVEAYAGGNIRSFEIVTT